MGTSKELLTFLEKQFQRKLSYDQVCEILDNYNIPSADCLITPTLDLSIVNQITPLQTKKCVQDRNKEMAVVQRAYLNTTGPLCSLHDALSSGTQVPTEEIKSIVEQTLCLLGSTNHHMSVLWRKKVLANINKDKISLAEQPLPNAKRFLFGEDFPPLLQNKLTSLVALPRTYQMFQNPDNLTRNLGPPRIGHALRPQVPFLSTRQTGQKTIGPFVLKRDPQTKTQHLISKVETNYFRPM